MCCEADWKREVVQDHKWDFINVAEFHRTDFWTRIKYVWRYILLFKSLAVMGLDIFTAITMVSSNHWTNALTQKAADSKSGIDVQFAIAKWVFVGCIIFSFLLYGYEFYKAKQVIASRDIAYAFTNLQANDYFAFKNYDNFCLFCHIESSTKRKDDLSFWVFFTFKDWKRLLLADGPRQSINGLMLYSFGVANGWQTYDIPAWWDREPVTAILLFAMLTTVLIFAGSLLLLIAASIMYIPLLCYIQGNLKEYVCVKVDKRLQDLIKKKQRQRAQRAAALEKRLARDGGLRNSKGEFVNVVLQPTLPKIDLDDDELSLKGQSAARSGISRSRSGDALGAYGLQSSYPGSYDAHGYPPSLDYGNDYGSKSTVALYGRDDFSGSTTRLTDAAGPMGISYPPVAAALPSAAPSFPPSAYAGPSRGPSPTMTSGYSNQPYGQMQGQRVPPSRSLTQLSGMSASSGGYPRGAAAAGPGLGHGYGQEAYQNQDAQRQQFRSSPPYPQHQPSHYQPQSQPQPQPQHQPQSYLPRLHSNASFSQQTHTQSRDAYAQTQPGMPPARQLSHASGHAPARHDDEPVLSPASYGSFGRDRDRERGAEREGLGMPRPYAHAHARAPATQSADGDRRESSSRSGLPYDRPDTDFDVDAYAYADAESDPAPSYYSGSPPRRGAAGEKSGWR